MKQERDSKGRFLPKEKVYARGIKGFRKGLICAPRSKHEKQYAEDTVFEETGGKICGPGVMHAAETAADVLDYIPLINADCTLSEFAKVEALAPAQRRGTKWATTKMRIGKKLSLEEFVKAYVDDTVKAVAGNKTAGKYVSAGEVKERVNCAAHSVKIADAGLGTRIYSSGSDVKIAGSGDWSKITSVGSCTQIVSCGHNARINSSGSSETIASSGNRSQITSSANYAQIVSSGLATKIVSCGRDTKIISSGDATKVSSSGDFAKIVGSGKGTVISAIGKASVVSAELGSWIGLAEYDDYGKCICAKFAQVDGIKLKPGIRYRLENGEFKEVK